MRIVESFALEGDLMLVELDLVAGRGSAALLDFVRGVQREAYDRGRVDGLAEGLLRGLEIDPASQAGAVLASLVHEGTLP